MRSGVDIGARVGEEAIERVRVWVSGEVREGVRVEI